MYLSRSSLRDLTAFREREGGFQVSRFSKGERPAGRSGLIKSTSACKPQGARKLIKTRGSAVQSTPSSELSV